MSNSPSPFSHGSCTRGLVHKRFFIGYVNDEADMMKANAFYSSRRREAQEAFRSRDWEGYIALHEKPYRPTALARCVRRGLSGERYWKSVASVWIGTENYFQYRELWNRLWFSSEGNRSAAMDGEEQQAFADFPEKVTAWRGSAGSHRKHALAWTLSEKVARRFAARSGKDGRLLKAIVEKEDVLAHFLRRGEQEIICRKVRILSVTPT